MNDRKPPGLSKKIYTSATPMTGITLIELVIVVAIVGILAALAYPSYQDQVIKARRTDGTSALLGLAMQMEKYAYDQGQYPDGSTAGQRVQDMIGKTTSSEDYYQVSISAYTAGCPRIDCYEIQAAPVSGTSQENDTRCDTLILSSTGVKDADGSCDGSPNTCAKDCW